MRTIVVGLFLVLFGIQSVVGQDVQFYSQSGQDQMVDVLLYKILGKQDKGYYLDVGASDPIQNNNTYFFEKNYGWEGVSIDISPRYQAAWERKRCNPLLVQDALKTDYDALLMPYPHLLDYLSVDIDNHYDEVLKKIPFDRNVFKIITIEHDAYVYGDVFQKKEREILSALGYFLLCEDIVHGVPYEDWWIHPSAFPTEVLVKLMALDLKNKDYNELISTLKSVID